MRERIRRIAGFLSLQPQKNEPSGDRSRASIVQLQPRNCLWTPGHWALTSFSLLHPLHFTFCFSSSQWTHCQLKDMGNVGILRNFQQQIGTSGKYGPGSNITPRYRLALCRLRTVIALRSSLPLSEWVGLRSATPCGSSDKDYLSEYSISQVPVRDI